MKVCGTCESQAYQVEECSNRVDDEKRRKRVAGARRQIECLVIGGSREEAICQRSVSACELGHAGRGLEPVL